MDRMPEWFSDRFAFFVNESRWTTLEIAAEHFWKEVLQHVRYPSQENPSLTGYTGWVDECPSCVRTIMQPGVGNSGLSADGKNGGLWTCERCRCSYTRMEDKFVKIEV